VAAHARRAAKGAFYVRQADLASAAGGFRRSEGA